MSRFELLYTIPTSHFILVSPLLAPEILKSVGKYGRLNRYGYESPAGLGASTTNTNLEASSRQFSKNTLNPRHAWPRSAINILSTWLALSRLLRISLVFQFLFKCTVVISPPLFAPLHLLAAVVCLFDKVPPTSRSESSSMLLLSHKLGIAMTSAIPMSAATHLQFFSLFSVSCLVYAWHVLAQAVWTANQAMRTTNQRPTRKIVLVKYQHALRVANSGIR